tara:strand:- start:207 stop:359 length:153 start_codon:yes stop_codon:yes gene_type:complete
MKAIKILLAGLFVVALAGCLDENTKEEPAKAPVVEEKAAPAANPAKPASK